MTIFSGKVIQRTILGMQKALALKNKTAVVKFLNMTGKKAFNKLTGKEKVINELNQTVLRMAAAERNYVLEMKILQANAAIAEKRYQSEIEKLHQELSCRLAQDLAKDEFNHKLYEALFLQQRALEEEKRTALGELIGLTAHKANNALTGIMGAASLIEIIDPEKMDQQTMKSMMKTILASSEELRSVIKRLMLYNGPMAEIKNLNPNPIIVQTVETLKSVLPKTIPYEIFLKLDSKGLIGIPEGQVIIILENLIKNSIEAMPKGGNINISTEEIKLKKRIKGVFYDIPEGDYIKLVVSDNGCGIEKSIFSKIFDPGFTTAKFGQKEGLGLSAVWGIVYGCNGFIDVKTELGKGTTFYLYFPVVVI